MSKKRTAAESNDGKEEDSDLALRHGSKRVKLTPSSNKQIQDLPIKLLERILVKAVIKEVRSMKLAKRVWKEKAGFVICRLRTVCLHWSRILTTKTFLAEVHRILDGSAQEKIRLEILHQIPFQFQFETVTILNEEVFVLFEDQEGQEHVSVYDLSNMAKAKEVVALGDKTPEDIKACNLSNCVYVLCSATEFNDVTESSEICNSVVRIKRGEDNRLDVFPWIIGHWRTIWSISVSPNGILSLIFFSTRPATINSYDENGSLVQSVDIHGFFLINKVIQKSNGNLVLTSARLMNFEITVAEIEADGRIKRQHTSPRDVLDNVSLADAHGRIVVTSRRNGIELLDLELNHLECDVRQLGRLRFICGLDYDSDRNELIGCGLGLLTIFRFTEE